MRLYSCGFKRQPPFYKLAGRVVTVRVSCFIIVSGLHDEYRMTYLLKHWRGEQSLAWSFWINLVAVRILLHRLQQWLGDQLEPPIPVVWVLIWVLVCHVALLIWQLVGVLRAAENDFSTRGTIALVWAVQVVAALAFIHTALSVFGVSLLFRPPSQDQLRWDAMIASHSNSYELSVADNGRRLLIKGDLASGIAKNVEEALASEQGIEQVLLSSGGGSIYEARALAGYFRQYSLNTHVVGTCASACTTAYIGGTLRTVSQQARLGFHQYRIDADYAILATSPAKEQAKDQVIFRNAGVSASFVDNVFAREPDSMWWPTLNELLIAGVIHQIR